MNYYARLDISMKETSIAICDSNGKFVYESVCETEPELIVKRLKESGYQLEKIGFEAGYISFW